MSPNCIFIKLTVSMKKPFLLPCFPSPAFSLLLLLRLVCLLNTFTFKVGAVVWFFTAERSQAEMTVCSTLCVWEKEGETESETALHGGKHCTDR